MTFRPTDPFFGQADPATAKTTLSLRKVALAWSATDPEPGTLRVAFASRDRVHVDQHFGAAEGFVIFTVDAERARLAGVLEFPPENMDGNENKLGERIRALEGCAAVYCLAVGGSAVRQLLAANIQPIRLENAASIDPLLNSIRDAINAGGVQWIDRRIHRDTDDSRFERMAAEGWQE
ncbi:MULTISPECIES: NifB/NifX family molybdenum-iron cluster-binding protein [Niveibacterium]|uniref:NifB/NifX family molybdenum-iron cluster-binding protein n=1 Tax=Niveibacterium TaxID=1769726 RepID=UPI001F5D99E2|nr:MULTISPECIES: NifB/NifX family molybdenum-iron cluster-binding protein [Niveibacterium]